jgi:hypothetical protein
MGGECGTYRGRLLAGFWWRYLRGRDHLEELAVDGRILLKLIFKNWIWSAWTGLIWLSVGTGGGRL